MLKNSEIYSYIVGSHFMGINTLFEHYYQASWKIVLDMFVKVNVYY